jgi:hypothetical protein
MSLIARCQTCPHRSVDRCRKTNRHITLMDARGEPCPLDLAPKAESGTRKAEHTKAQSDSRPVCDVVIPCHNYAHYLAECVESVRASSVAAELIVIDDGSTDGTRAVAERLGVRCVRIDAGSAIRARQAGFERGSRPYVMFLDADDVVDPDYLRTGIARLQADPAVGIVYSDFDCFGDRTGRRILNYDRDAIAWRNSIHAGSIYRRAALEISRAMELETSHSSHDDWSVARRVIRDGWLVAKNPTPYRYRQHEASMMRSRTEGERYYDQANLAREPVTLMIPISGRPHAMDAMFRFLDRQTRDRSTITLILADGSGSEAAEGIIRTWLANCDYPDARYLKLDVGQRPGLADEDRRTNGQSRADVRLVMARIYTRLRAEVATDYVWILEDDIIPPDDCCDRLLRSMDPGVAAVGAPYRSRYHDGYVARRANDVPIDRPGIGVEQIETTGFGCVVMRPAFLRSGPITHVGKYADYDLNFFDWLKTQNQKLLVDWSCEAEHLGAVRN